LKLGKFPLLTDENVDPDVVAGRRGLGFDVLDVVEGGRAATCNLTSPIGSGQANQKQAAMNFTRFVRSSGLA